MGRGVGSRPEDPDRSGRALGFVARYGNLNGNVSKRVHRILTGNGVFLNKYDVLFVKILFKTALYGLV